MARKKGHPQATTPPHDFKAFSVPPDIRVLGEYGTSIAHEMRLDHEARRQVWKRKKGKEKGA